MIDGERRAEEDALAAEGRRAFGEVDAGFDRLRPADRPLAVAADKVLDRGGERPAATGVFARCCGR